MNFETINMHRAGKVATISLNRPENLNAFNDQMINESLEALTLLETDDEIRCIVITGTGRAFSAGQDLKNAKVLATDISFKEHLQQGYNKLVLMMTQMQKPIIAAVNGIAAGAGFGVALAADMRLASHQASFMLAFSKLGLIPDSGLTWFLTRLMGYGRAYEKAITAERISAEEAFTWGIVNYIIPHDELMSVTNAWAIRLAAASIQAASLTKRAMYDASTMSLRDALKNEAYLQDIAGNTQDFREGVKAFLEKRAPNFDHE